MEEFNPEGLFYKYHSGSPGDEEYAEAAKELILKLNLELPVSLFPKSPSIENVPISSSNDFLPKERNRSLIQSWAEILEEIFSSDLRFMALDADLSYDTGTYKVAQSFKSRYIQCGIAEQDMVSMAGALALSGKVPIVHSFASFLTTRAAEQIFNNLSEHSKIVYCGFLAGILPSAPGHSHQAVSDFGIISSFPNIEIFEPACETELRLMKTFIHETDNSIYLRIGSVDLPEPAPVDSVSVGKLTTRKIGSKFAIITSGPSMTRIALEAADLVAGGLVSVFTYPTPGRQLSEYDLSKLSEYKKIVVLENHMPALGIFQNLSRASISEHLSVTRIGVCELPRNGRTDEVLNFHGMDAASIKHELLS
jgi:transketolase